MSKRKRQAILFFTYGFMTLAVIVITVVCLLLVLGYRFDVKDKRIEQGGLIQFRTMPAAAQIVVDGVQLDGKTPTKTEVSAGSHTVVMRRDGYENWQKTVSVDAGELRWLDYARLIPKTIASKSVAPAANVTAAQASPNHEYIAALATDAPTAIKLFDIRDQTKVTAKSFVIPEAVLTKEAGAASSLLLVEWDISSRYLLVQHRNGTVVEYIRIDRTVADGAARNITREYNLPFHDMHFSGTSGNVYYAMTGTDIRRVDVGAKSVSQPLVIGVESYVLYGDATIAYVARTPAQTLVGLLKNDKATTIRTLPVSEPVWVDYTEYFYHRYLAIGSRAHVDVVRDPVDAASSLRPYVTTSLPYEIQWLRFSDNGRMLFAGSGRAYDVYDLETSENTLVNTDEAGTDGAPMLLDNYYLIDNPTDTLRLYEFDGTNRHTVVKSERTLPAVLSSDQRYLYSFVREADALVLQSSRFVLD
ncbi:MAG: PEGA domain-containing protein [Candidatus Saccharimonadales bacterium]